MNILIGYCRGIKFVGGYQFWSNPSMVGTRASIPAVLMNPTFIDLVNLSVKFGGQTLLDANNHLHNDGRLPDFLFESNRHSIQSCIKAQEQQRNSSAKKDVEVISARESIRIPSVIKRAAMCRRIKSRDIFDLHTLIQRGILTFPEVIAEMLKVKPLFTYEHLAHRLISATIPDDDEGLSAVSDVNINTVRQRLQDRKDEAEADVFNFLAAALPGN